ncbi:MAG: hypothetical protein M3441_05630 [Chloroflexota bacterium]|nr:hypothetical protein [Chloroflexota bacterium]
MKNHDKPHGATTVRRKDVRFLSALGLAGAIFALALLALVALPGMAQAAPASAGGKTILLQQGDPTAQTDVTNQQGGSEEDQPLNGGSTDNNSNSGTTNNSTNSQQNPPGDDQQGSTQGGNVAGNTGGQDGTGMGFSWWLIAIPAILIAIAVPFLRRRPVNEPATANPAPDLERRDEA